MVVRDQDCTAAVQHALSDRLTLRTQVACCLHCLDVLCLWGALAAGACLSSCLLQWRRCCRTLMLSPMCVCVCVCVRPAKNSLSRT
jgi:hypothetical protein